MISEFWINMARGTDPGASTPTESVRIRRGTRRVRHRAASRHHSSAPANSLNTPRSVASVTGHRIKVGHDL